MNYMAGTYKESTFLIFGSCEPVRVASNIYVLWSTEVGQGQSSSSTVLFSIISLSKAKFLIFTQTFTFEAYLIDLIMFLRQNHRKNV